MAGGSPAPAPVPELPPDDVIREILLRLPPHPAILPRVSLVCKHWRRLLRDPAFLARLRARRRLAPPPPPPPLLGFFDRVAPFVPAGDPPSRVSAAHFSRLAGGRWRVLGCRHGRVLLCTRLAVPLQLLVWDPITGARTPIVAPQNPRLATNIAIRGALLCGAAARGRRGGCAGDGEGCRSGPFRVIYFFPGQDSVDMFAAVYSSQAAAWGDMVLVTVPTLAPVIGMEPSVLVGNALYWLTSWRQERKIVGFDMDTNMLHLFDDLPRDCGAPYDCYQFVKSRYGGLLGIAALRGLQLYLFEFTLNSEGAMTWVEYRSIELDKILPPAPPVDSSTSSVKAALAFDEDGDLIFVKTRDGIFELHLKSLEVNAVVKHDVSLSLMVPYRSFCIAGVAVAVMLLQVMGLDSSRCDLLRILCSGFYADDRGFISNKSSMAMLPDFLGVTLNFSTEVLKDEVCCVINSALLLVAGIVILVTKMSQDQYAALCHLALLFLLS
ncbi:hypothetical protein ACP4OV_003550 [Aristida adscensionis]